jgi:hypothetical protein
LRFLRQHRHEVFDEAFESELGEMYRASGEGKQPVAPALLAMVLLLQAYTGASDAHAVESPIVDACGQMELGVVGQTRRRPPRERFQPFASASSPQTWIAAWWNEPSSWRGRPERLTGRSF